MTATAIRFAEQRRYSAREAKQQLQAHRQPIVQYYLRHTLKDTQVWVKDEYRVEASRPQLRDLFNKWGIKKNKRATPNAEAEAVATTESVEAAKLKRQIEPEAKDTSLPKKRKIGHKSTAEANSESRTHLVAPSSPHKACTGVEEHRDLFVRTEYLSGLTLGVPQTEPTSLSTSNRRSSSNQSYRSSSPTTLVDIEDTIKTEQSPDHTPAVPPAENSSVEGTIYKVQGFKGDDAQELGPPSLLIDTADATRGYSKDELPIIQDAANYLFVCGLKEDSFPLYFLIWKQSMLEKSDAEMDLLVQCIRSACTREHCIILDQPIKGRLKCLRSQLGPIDDTGWRKAENRALVAQACLLLLTSARICNSIGKDEESNAARYKIADQYLKSLDGIFFNFGATSPVGMLTAAGTRNLSAAIVEELVLSESAANEHSGPTSILSPFRRQRPSLPSHSKYKSLDATQAGYLHAQKQTKKLLDLMVYLLANDTKAIRWRSPHRSLEPEVGNTLLCHVWLTYLIPRKPIIEKYKAQLEGFVSMECVAATISVLLDPTSEPESVPSCHDFEMQLDTALDKLLKVLSGDHKHLSVDAFVNGLQSRFIWMLRRRVLGLSTPSPEARQNLRAFVQETLKVVLPEVPHPMAMAGKEDEGQRHTVLETTTILRAFSTSERSSYRYFAQCAQSVLSIYTHCSSSYSAFLSQRSDIARLGNIFDKLSSSMQSMRIAEEPFNLDALSVPRNGFVVPDHLETPNLHLQRPSPSSQH